MNIQIPTFSEVLSDLVAVGLPSLLLVNIASEVDAEGVVIVAEGSE